MGYHMTAVIAQWDRPLIELSATEQLGYGGIVVDESFGDESLSWKRSDGWQCFAPTEFYNSGPGYGLVPPVAQMQRETGGPVLGLGVDSTDHWEVAFVLDGQERWIAAGPSEEGSSAHFEAEMVRRWGPDWIAGATAGLVAWASPFATVDPFALHALLSVDHLFGQDKLADLQRLLTLVPEPGHSWWTDGLGTAAGDETGIPGARYAVAAGALRGVHLTPPTEDFFRKILALVFTETGVGIWDHENDAWAREPVLRHQDALAELDPLLRKRGWEPPPIWPGWPSRP